MHTSKFIRSFCIGLFVCLTLLLAGCGGGGGGSPPPGSTTCVWDQSTSKWDNCTYGS